MTEIIHLLEIALNSLRVARDANDQESFRACLSDMEVTISEQLDRSEMTQ